jgi:hypothetical protein
MMTCKIKFVDGYPYFNPAYNYIVNPLRKHFNLEFAPDPDYLFYSVTGYEHAEPRYDHCVKIWYTDENFRPDFTRCDYALSFDLLDDPRHLRLPLYTRCARPDELVKPGTIDVETVLRARTKFCNFVYTNTNAQTRIRFLRKLARYKPVDCGGTVCNNMGGQKVNDKLAFLSSYKFTIAFENARHPGYTTEKLTDPMMAGSIPIYWGNREVGRDWNTRSFVNCHEYSSFDEVVEEIIRLDQDDGRYLAKLKQPWFHDNLPGACFRPDYLIPFFERVFATPRHTEPRWSGMVPRDFGILQGMPEFRDYYRNLKIVTGPRESRSFE